MAQRGHALTLLSFVTPEQTVAPELQAACERVLTVPAPHRSRLARLRALLSSQADLARRLWSAEYAQALAQLVNESKFDFVQIEGLELAEYFFSLPPSSATATTRFVYDAHNAEYVIQQRALKTDQRQPARWPAALYSALQVPRLRQLEQRVCQRVHAVTCVSAEDASALQKLVPALTPTIVPNGIDIETYTPFIPRHPSLAPRLIFTGKMDYRPNLDAAVWFAREIFPRIRAARPEAEFVVVGQQPPKRLEKLNGQNGIVITGVVEDVRPYIASARVYVAPLRMGGGTRFKLLEAMALARPIVSTTIGAEGFALTSGRELILADTPQAFAEAVLILLNDPARAEALALAGQAFVRARYDWGAIVPELEKVYEALRNRLAP